MSGGRISLPIEYFGTPTNNYFSKPMMQDISVSTDFVRAGLIETGVLQTGGGSKRQTMSSRSDGFLDFSDYKKLEQQYEQKYMRKLNLKPVEKKALINSLNKDIENAMMSAVKDNLNGRLTKTSLLKKLKTIK